MTGMEFPQGYFYIKSSASGDKSYVLDIERSFFGNWGSFKEGSKTCLNLQRSDTDHDGLQLYKYEEGWLVNKQSSLCLEAEGGKYPNFVECTRNMKR